MQQAGLSSRAEEAKQRCALDKPRELQWLTIRLVVELFDEVELPSTTTNLPCSERKCEDGDEANNDDDWSKSGLDAKPRESLWFGEKSRMSL